MQLLEKMGKFWIQDAIKHKGALRKTLGVSKKTGKIPKSRIQEAAESGGKKTKKRAILAQTLAGLRKKKEVA